MERGLRMACMVAIVGVSLAMGAGRPEQAGDEVNAAAARGDAGALTVRGFEDSGFLERYRPVDRRRNWHGGQLLHAWLFDDPENPRGRILVELGPSADDVQFVTVVWHGETLYTRASWTSMKSRFIADLVESTFPEVDYGELSAYVWRQQERSYPEGVGAMPKAVLPGAKVIAGASGSSLVVGFERYPKAQP
jgi:hypothetical protein